jgi:arabinogalactan endo-1,4-beta-galactosidase
MPERESNSLIESKLRGGVAVPETERGPGVHQAVMSFRRTALSVLTPLLASALLQCSNGEKAPNPPPGAGGSGATGGTAGSGTAGNGAGTGGTSGATGGAGTGGTAGSASGAGGTSGGAAGAGGATGGAGAAGSGAGRGGASGAGASGAAGQSGGAAGGAGAPRTFMIGADISQIQQQEDTGSRFVDGTEKDPIALFKDRGFNWIRLRAFVDPTAEGGYSPEGYCDTAHTVTMGARVKDAGMGFLLDLHYSDYWADPGKQIKPLAWRDITTIEELATEVHDYTKATVQAMVAGGARPDMVSIGNEITPGLLLHVPNDPSDPDGALTVTMPNGSIDDWPSLGTLLKAGVAGVHEVDPTIEIMLHTDRGGSASASVSFVENAIEQGVPFDVYGVSCYIEYQGGPDACSDTMNAVIDAVPDATFGIVIAEYAVEPADAASIELSIRGTNDAVWELPNARGAGTFFWEPSRSGAWGDGLFTWGGGNTATAVDGYMDFYEQMKTDYVR